MTKLPDKLSALIRVALADLRKCENDPRFRVNFEVWLVGGERCHVCLAGAVMAKSLSANRFDAMTPSDFSHSDSSKLFAINLARLGEFQDALLSIGTRCDVQDMPFMPDIPEYEDEPEYFHAAMSTAADLLEKKGF